MSKLSQLAGKGEKFNIGGIELEINPLTMSDMDLIMRLGNKDTTAMRELLEKVLKESVPESTEDEINKISAEHLTTLIDAVMKVNHLEMDKEKQEFLEEIKKKQSGRTR